MLPRALDETFIICAQTEGCVLTLEKYMVVGWDKSRPMPVAVL